MTKKVVTFNEDGIGEVNKRAFAKTLPEGITLDIVAEIDKCRDNFTAKVSNEALDYSKDAFEKPEHPEVITVPYFSLGGDTGAEVVVEPTFRLIASRVVSNNKAMDAVIERANALYKESNGSIADKLEA